MSRKTILIFIASIFVFLSLAANVLSAYVFVSQQHAYQQQQKLMKYLVFRNMFTKDVLLSDQEINFNTRMTLETSVRSLNDAEVFNQWQAFTKAQTTDEATMQAKELLELLIEKTSAE